VESWCPKGVSSAGWPGAPTPVHPHAPLDQFLLHPTCMKFVCKSKLERISVYGNWVNLFVVAQWIEHQPASIVFSGSNLSFFLSWSWSHGPVRSLLVGRHIDMLKVLQIAMLFLDLTSAQ
jgi:hypothetical protein